MTATLDPSRVATDEAVERVERHADSEWKAAALAAVRWVATRRPELTTDAVWHVLQRDYAHARTHEPRALGPVMRRAAREGIVEATERTHLSRRPECHSNPKRVWRSLVFRSAS